MRTNIARKYVGEVCVDVLEHSGYKARIMAAMKLSDNGKIHNLPPGTEISAVPIHCLPGSPENWVRESGSYVIPVTPDVGLWFDWTMNDEYSTAIVPSVKGMNPITGQKMEGCQMEQYRDVCPIHKIHFAHGRYCEECKYSWPPQNYIGYPNKCWFDGFFQPDGTVRQFFYTEDENKDVATALIGKPNTMPAFGFAFFKYKHDEPVQKDRRFMSDLEYINDLYLTKMSKIYKNDSKLFEYKRSNITGSFYDLKSEVLSYREDPVSVYSSRSLTSDDSFESSMDDSEDSIKNLSQDDGRAIHPELYETTNNISKEVSIGAGAVIGQSIKVDTRPLEDYYDKPQALIRIYFCFEDQFRAIVAKGGVKKLEQQKHGFLHGVPVGG